MKAPRPALFGLALLVVGGLLWILLSHRKAEAQVRPLPLSPAFTMTAPELDRLTAALPKDIAARIRSAPSQFLSRMAEILDEPAIYFVLVDKSHPIGADYLPADLVPLKGYQLAISRTTLELRRSIMPEVVAMSKAARAAGITLLLSSTYRSYDYQRYVYDREVRLYGKSVADRESAVPGTSQHQLGTAIDFGSISDAFAKTAASKWLVAHAWEYGFSLSYPQGLESVTGYRYESWHYRYITRPGTQMQRDFFDDVQQYLLEFLHENRAAFAGSRVHR